MRHRKAGRKLNRSWEHRKAMYRNMARSLVVHESIRTTEARAKEMRKVADNLVTLAVKGDLHSRRQAYKVLGDHGLVKRLFDDIGPRFAGISGGYTRVVKLGLPRPGDAAKMAVIEFSVRAGETAEKETGKKGKKAKAKKEEPAKTAKKAAKKAEPKVEEVPSGQAPAEEPKVEEPEAEAAPAEEPKAEASAEEAPAEEPEAETAEKEAPEVEELPEKSPAERKAPEEESQEDENK